MMSPGNEPLPIVVDLDGTLTPTDTLVESIVGLIKQRPWTLLLLPLWLFGGRFALKNRVAAEFRLSVAHLPWRQDLIDWLTAERSKGRKVILATAAHQQIAADVASALPLFDGVLASEAGINLKGTAKLAAIQTQVGPHFSYVGDSRADVPIWAAADSAILVGASPSVTGAARNSGARIEREFAGVAGGASVWLKAIRAHQWLKNLLLFVPLLTSFTFTNLNTVLVMLMAFGAFCLATSGTYLLNDIWDLESDRQHARKRARPLASGRLSLQHGVAAAIGLMGLGIALGWAASHAFAAMLVGYIVLTTFYSWVLKGYVLIDVLALALLYTYRVLAGAVAIQVALSPWLLAFSVFTFFSLALVKRCGELVALKQEGKEATRGRDYRVSDLAVLWPLGVGSGLCSVLVFGLFIGSPEARATYGDTPVMWLVGIGLIYWIARLWVKTSRGEMHDDPIVFALRDRGSRIAVAAMAVVPVFAHFLE